MKEIINRIRYIFNFKTPHFLDIHYVDYMIENKSYFLFSWKYRNAFKLSIKKLDYSTSKSRGSGYIIVPENVNNIEIIISNTWKKTTFQISFSKTKITSQIDFNPQIKFDGLEIDLNHINNLKILLNPVAIKATDLKIKNSIVKIQNHSFHY